MNALFLYGLGCTGHVWDDIRPDFARAQVDYAEYPHEITQQARCVGDITEWVGRTYGERAYDCIIGHSMGGIAALQLAAAGFPVRCVVLIESNLKPAGAFYRNLLLPANEARCGAAVTAMLKAELCCYSDALKQSLHEGFDYTDALLRAPCPVFGIYGDRGRPGDAQRIDALHLDAKALQSIRLKFVENACHMPMLENPAGLARILSDCLAEAGLPDAITH